MCWASRWDCSPKLVEPQQWSVNGLLYKQVISIHLQPRQVLILGIDDGSHEGADRWSLIQMWVVPSLLGGSMRHPPKDDADVRSRVRIHLMHVLIILRDRACLQS